MQNPPSIPNLFAIWLSSFIGRYKVIIDFHNYGYTILNLNVKNKFIIKIAKWYEHFFAKKAFSFLCVSEQMKLDLKNNWDIDAVPLYDRPVKREYKNVDKNEFLGKYGQGPIQ